MKKTILLKALPIFLLICWMLVIFLLSAQKAVESSNLSDGIVFKVVNIFYSDFDNLSKPQQIELLQRISHFVRKTAHFLEYFILGALAFWVATMFERIKLFGQSVIAFAICVVYAVSDEIHQYFVPGRACRFGDVLIDSFGSFLAIIIIAVLIKNLKKLGENHA